MKVRHVVCILIGGSLVGGVVHDVVSQLEHSNHFGEIILERRDCKVLHLDEMPFIEGSVFGQATPKVNQHLSIYK